MIFFLIVGVTIFVSMLSLIGAATLLINRRLLDKILILFVGFAAGSLMGSSFLHLLPEALEISEGRTVLLYTLIGFTLFFFMERYLYWRHCHNGVCDVHTFTYLNLWGDALHNFVDGIVIATSFLTEIRLGMVATFAIILHEIPQEISDFGIMIYGGFKKTKALFLNFLCGLTAVLGAVAGFFLAGTFENFSKFLIPFTAGGFIYIASSDLIPELHKQKEEKYANLSFLLFLVGIILMYIVKIIN